MRLIKTWKIETPLALSKADLVRRRLEIRAEAEAYVTANKITLWEIRTPTDWIMELWGLER